MPAPSPAECRFRRMNRDHGMSRPICPICDSSDTVALPVPHPGQSMVSDGRVVERPLAKVSCRGCGYGFHIAPLDGDHLSRLFRAGYELGLHDAAGDRARAEAYGERILALLAAAGRRPGSIIEVGCGTGALLGLLAERLDLDAAFGIEASPSLADRAARRAGPKVTIRPGFAETFTADRRYPLCLAVNVMEHAPDPAAFLDACRRTVDDDGALLIVCPDGETPSPELLVFDHVSSFTRASMHRLAGKAGLSIEREAKLDGPLDGFSAFLLRVRKDEEAGLPTDCDPHALSLGRERYLHGWQQLEERTGERLGERPYAIFGTGEFSFLFNAYAPALVARARRFVADTPTAAQHLGRPVVATADFLAGGDDALLLAVHPRNRAAVAARFAAAGRDIVTSSDETGQTDRRSAA